MHVYLSMIWIVGSNCYCGNSTVEEATTENTSLLLPPTLQGFLKDVKSRLRELEDTISTGLSENWHQVRLVQMECLEDQENILGDTLTEYRVGFSLQPSLSFEDITRYTNTTLNAVQLRQGSLSSRCASIYQEKLSKLKEIFSAGLLPDGLLPGTCQVSKHNCESSFFLFYSLILSFYSLSFIFFL